MPEVAGSVVITIGGDLTAFEAALSRAKQQATAFDAHISAQLSGAGVSEGLAKIAAGVEQTNALLAKLTTSGTSAGAALTKVAASTTATTAALTKVATATKLVNAEMASIGGSGGGAAALAAGTISAKDFAAALEATGGNLSKITPQMVGLAAANEEVAATSKGAAVGMVELGVAEKETAGLSAGVTRELSVLLSEIARGRFTNIPASLLVLNERLVSTGTGVLTLANGMKALGGLASVVFDPFVLGFLAISLGADVAVRAFGSMRGGINEVGTALEGNKKLIDEITASYPNMTAELKKYEQEAKNLPKSVVAADTATAQTATQKALTDTMNNMRRQMDLLDTGDGDFARIGNAGIDAFDGISRQIRAGTLDAEGLLNELGKIQLNPALSKNAHEFAAELEVTAKAAVKLESSIGGQKAIKDIVVDGQKAQQTLFDVSAGFKDVGAKAGSADATIAKLFGTMNSGGGSGFGVTRSIADQFGSQFSSQIQATAGMFQTVDQAVQQARQDQLASMMQLQSQFHATTTEVDVLKQALATAGGKDNIRDFFGDVTNIKNANAEIENSVATVQKLFAAMATGNTSVNAVSQGLDMIRQTLINDGFPTVKVDAFLNRLEEANRQLVADQGQVHQLGAAVNALHDRTITITVQTRQVGTGTQSTYDVPGGPVSVTRYGGNGSPGFTQQSYQVPSEGGYGSQGGSGTGTGTVNVTRFATGGMYHPGDTQQVSFFKSPDETVAIFTPQQRNALANPQSGFTGTQPTKEEDRYWTVLMNIEAATQKTAQLLDEINTASRNSAISSGSSSGYSSGGNSQGSDQFQQYLQALGAARANYAAIGGGGLVGYGSDALAASPEQIAYNIAYRGMSSVGSPSGGGSGGGGGYQTLPGGQQYPELAGLTPSSPGYAQAYNSALARVNKASGFATGGMIAPGDTQEVRFFKSPEETVGIFTPAQMKAMQGGSDASKSGATADNRPIVINNNHYWNGNAPPSRDSMAAVDRQTELGTRRALRSVNGR